MDLRFLSVSSALLIFLASAGMPPPVVSGTSPSMPRSASPDAAEFLRSAMFQFRPDPQLSFTSKADFTSPEDNIDAGVVREGPEPSPTGDLVSALSAAVLDRIQVGYDHTKHAQMIQTQHQTPYTQQHPVYQRPLFFPAKAADNGQNPTQPSNDYGQTHAPPLTEYGQDLVEPPLGYEQNPIHPPAEYYNQQQPVQHQQHQPVQHQQHQLVQHQQHQPVQHQQHQLVQHQQQPQQHPPGLNQVQTDSVPPPISKEELNALYQAALQKGSHLDISQLPPNADGLGEPNVGSMPGYYYYYYPIKKFPKPGENGEDDKDKGQNGDGNGDGNEMDGNTKGPTKVEPLFVAVSAFIGASMVFMFSLLFLPKIGFLRSNGIGLLSRLAPDDLTGLTRVVLESIDGKDCDLRIACELGRVLRKFQLHDKPIRFLESFVSKEAKVQLQNVRRAGIYRPKCGVIRCKRRQRST